MPYSLVLERASGTHNYSVQRKVEPTHLRVLCSVPVSQAHSNKFRFTALEALCFISLWCLGAQRKGMVIIMDTSGILRPEQLPFKVPPDLEYAINELLAAWERDEKLNLDCYLDEVQAAARSVSEENDAWVRRYYVQYGWRKNDDD